MIRRFVCMHGIGGARSDWAGVSPRLARLGEVICLDMVVSPLDEARDLIVAQLAEHPCETVLVGHSRGGILALMAAAHRPELVDAIVLSAGYVPPNRAERSWTMGIASWVNHRARLAGSFLGHGHLTARRPDRSASFLTSLPAVLQMAGVGLRPAAFDGIARSVGCPVLAISGERDSHVPASWVGGAARRYGWSYATIPGGSHFAHVDDPTQWANAVEEWLPR